jgi:uncharacterized integral membrane protein
MKDTPGGAARADEQPVRRRNPVGARAVAALVIVGAVVILVVQNSQRVTLRFWFITGHVRLIWVIVVSVVVGGALGLLLGGHRRRRRRRQAASG